MSVHYEECGGARAPMLPAGEDDATASAALVLAGRQHRGARATAFFVVH